MKIEELRGATLLSFVNAMSTERLHGEAFRAFLEDNLDLARWGFRLSHMAHDKKGGVTKVVYNSDRCRVRFSLSNLGRGPEEDELPVEYGRLYAPDDSLSMILNGEECWCWHNSVPLLVLFLEGFSPTEIVDLQEKEGRLPRPPLLAAYDRSEEGRELGRIYPPASIIRREGQIWSHFGDRLFDLFDLRRPDLWEKYKNFLERYYQGYYQVHPRPHFRGDASPPWDRIC